MGGGWGGMRGGCDKVSKPPGGGVRMGRHEKGAHMRENGCIRTHARTLMHANDTATKRTTAPCARPPTSNLDAMRVSLSLRGMSACSGIASTRLAHIFTKREWICGF